MAFPYIPNGLPGLETRMPLLYSEGVATGRIDIHQFVAYTATNAAKPALRINGCKANRFSSSLPPQTAMMTSPIPAMYV